jgi:hypothetical protein
MALITFTHVQIPQEKAVEVAAVVTDELGWSSDLGVTRQQFLDDYTINHFKGIYEVAKRRENNASYLPPDPELQESE